MFQYYTLQCENMCLHLHFDVGVNELPCGFLREYINDNVSAVELLEIWHKIYIRQNY